MKNGLFRIRIPYTILYIQLGLGTVATRLAHSDKTMYLPQSSSSAAAAAAAMRVVKKQHQKQFLFSTCTVVRNSTTRSSSSNKHPHPHPHNYHHYHYNNYHHRHFTTDNIRPYSESLPTKGYEWCTRCQIRCKKLEKKIGHHNPCLDTPRLFGFGICNDAKQYWIRQSCKLTHFRI